MAYTWEVNKPASVRLGGTNPAGKSITFGGIDAASSDAVTTSQGIKGLFWFTGAVNDTDMATADASFLLMHDAIKTITEDVEQTE